MAKKRAPGGGRKPLSPQEETVKVAVTLLASQVEAMEKLGNGNLSAGIRKAIEMKKYSRRQHIIEKIADIICGMRLNDSDVEDANNQGWTLDLRFHDGQYVTENQWSRVENIHLDPDELAQVKRIAAALEATM